MWRMKEIVLVQYEQGHKCENAWMSRKAKNNEFHYWGVLEKVVENEAGRLVCGGWYIMLDILEN